MLGERYLVKKQNNRWKGIVSRFRSKLVKMILVAKKILAVNLMIVQSHLKLDKYESIGVMKRLKKFFLLTKKINV